MRIVRIDNRFEKGTWTHDIFRQEQNSTVAEIVNLIWPDINRDDYEVVASDSLAGIVGWGYVPKPHEEVRVRAKVGAAGGMALIGGVMSMVSSGSMWGFLGQLAAGIIIGYISNKFAPTGSASIDDSYAGSQTYSFSADTNPATPGTMLHIVQGTHVTGGTIIHQWMGGEKKSGILTRETMHWIIAVSEGPVKSISDITLDGQPITNFDGVTYDVRLGTADQTPFEGITQIGYHFKPSGRVTLKSGKPYVFNSRKSLDDMRIVLSIPSLFSVSDDGDIQSNSVQIKVRWAEEGEAFTDENSEIHTISAETKSETLYSIYKEFDTKAKRRFELTRITADFDQTSRREGTTYLKYWEELQDGTLNYPHVALIHVCAEASDQLSGALPETKCKCEGIIIPDIVEDPTTGGCLLSKTDTVWTDNPAYHVVYMLTERKRHGAGRDPRLINYAAWRKFADWCEDVIDVRRWDEATDSVIEETQGRFKWNYVLDTRQKAQAYVEKVCNTCETALAIAGGQIFFVPEAPFDGIPAMVVHENNILVDGNGVSTMKKVADKPEDIPNRVNAQFVDENTWERVELPFDDPAREHETVRNPETVNFFGITDPRVIQRMVYRMFRQAQAVNGVYQWEMGIEALDAKVGDYVLVAANRKMGWGGTAKLEKRYDGASFDHVAAVLGRSVYLEAGREYTVKVYEAGAATATLESAFTPTEDGYVTEIEVSGNSSDTELVNPAWTLSTQGGTPVPMQVRKIEKATDQRVKITALEYSEDVHNYDETLIAPRRHYDQPAFAAARTAEDSNASEPYRFPAFTRYDTPEVPPFVTEVTVTEDTRAVYNTISTDLLVGFTAVAMPEGSQTSIVRYDVWFREQAKEGEKRRKWTQSGPVREGRTYRIRGVDPGTTYEVVVCPVTDLHRSVTPDDAFAVMCGTLTPTGELPKIQAPTGVVVEHLNDGRMKVAWDKCDGESVREYHLYLDGEVVANVMHPVGTTILDGKLEKGNHILHIYPADLTGRLGYPAEVAVPVTGPAAPAVSVSFSGGNAVFAVTPGNASTYRTVRWIVATQGGEELTRSYGTTLTIPADWSGKRSLVVYGQDVAGNDGDRTTTVVEIVPPGAVTNITVASDGIRWDPAEAGTLPTTHYDIIDAVTGETVGQTVGTYHPLPDYDGTFYVIAVAGVNLKGAVKAVSVSRPAGFSLVTSYRSKFATGTATDAYADAGGTLFLPVYANKDWTDWFDGNGAATVDDLALLADLAGRPGPANGSYQETVDLGILYQRDDATEYQILVGWQCVGADGTTPDGLVTVEHSADGLYWTTGTTAALGALSSSVTLSIAHSDDIRHVRVTLKASSPSDELWAFTELGVDVLRAEENVVTGTVTISNAENGYYVALHQAVDIKDVELKMIYKTSTVPTIARLFPVEAYDDIENPGGVQLYILDYTGTKTVGRVRYTITYY
ncbi:phage tail protein [Pseudodesulfovibrio thermohalotolerans]|uniref:phage tail protein n=1 Tax=Pseudodesulfovibrio thermohalotolerans TaxID=2880651 RepID=UPI002442BD3F|nr:phage tail protein [Pseudodesulfovibrio thermohalotolerans]WFS64015.1 phage tail protein [Pseudodesulfovibrio thermohalotolerans]